MTLPSPQEARSRQTAMEAERHAFVSRLEPLVAEMHSHARDLAAMSASDNNNAQAASVWIERWARELERLITERTR